MSNYNVKIICFKEKKTKICKTATIINAYQIGLEPKKTTLLLKKNNYLYYFFNNLLTLAVKAVIIWSLLFAKITKGSWETNN